MSGARDAAGMKFDLYPGVGLTLADAAEWASLTESTGFDGLWALEAAREPFGPLALAAEHSHRIDIYTGVAVAFARNPMIMAQQAHELQRYSQGRFHLGLGSQVRPHIERRFSEAWSTPVRRMADYIRALRAIWQAWNDREPLCYEGEFYRHTLMTPMFDPGPSGQPPPRILVAGVGAQMIQMAARDADGLILHPLSSRRTVEQAVLPLVRDRVTRGGFEVACPVLVVTGSTAEETEAVRAAVRKQLAFYASTPAYRWVLELHGEGERADELRAMSRAGRWDDMTELITDELLHAFSVEAPPELLPDALRARFGGVLQRVALYTPHPLRAQTWQTVAAAVESLMP